MFWRNSKDQYGIKKGCLRGFNVQKRILDFLVLWALYCSFFLLEQTTILVLHFVLAIAMSLSSEWTMSLGLQYDCYIYFSVPLTWADEDPCAGVGEVGGGGGLDY